MRGFMRGARVLGVGWILQLKILAVSAFDGILNIIYPLFFATTALLMFRQSGDPQALVYAGLGAAVMGTWSAMATSASGALQGQRWQGTLELLVTAPTRVALAVLPITAALATVALYSLVATLIWGRVLFGIEVHIASPLAFAVALLVTLASLATFGFLLSVTVVRYRTGWALGNLLEYPAGCCAGSSCPWTCSRSGCASSPGRCRRRGGWTRSGLPRPGSIRGSTSPSVPGWALGMPPSARSCPSGSSTRRGDTPPWR
jgi:ABC-2 type transport system permease protein